MVEIKYLVSYIFVISSWSPFDWHLSRKCILQFMYFPHSTFDLTFDLEQQPGCQCFYTSNEFFFEDLSIDTKFKPFQPGHSHYFPCECKMTMSAKNKTLLI